MNGCSTFCSSTRGICPLTCTGKKAHPCESLGNFYNTFDLNFSPPTSIYGNPYQGQHAPHPPHLQRPQLDPHGVRPMHPQDYSSEWISRFLLSPLIYSSISCFTDSYLPPQFGPYIAGHPPNSHVRGPTPGGAGEDPKGKKIEGSLGGAQQPGGSSSVNPGPPHPAQLAHYEAMKAAGGSMYNTQYPPEGPHPGRIGVRHPGPPPPGARPEAVPNRGEFSGLVSYFSAQHDDLEQQ